MKIYLVGGAVRDKLLGLPIKEKDWVVVGATPEEMLAKEFKPVGKEFPVFLHPKTNEEYALARTERKIGKGYKGFTFYASADVTLEEDLKRRDLTINAMAETPEGQLIDPYGGQQDLKNKIFRHVSSAFQEDPVRILRVARLRAQFPDFKIHPDTLQFMQQMVKSGEVEALVAERVWQELSRALTNKKPIYFFDTLIACGALSNLFPAIETQALAALDRATRLTDSASVRFAALTHACSQESLRQMVNRYRIPNEFSELSLLAIRLSHSYQNCLAMSAADLLKFIHSADALRRFGRFQQFLLACEAAYPTITPAHRKKIETVVDAVRSVNTESLQEKKLSGNVFGEELEKLRISAINKVIAP